MSTTYDSLSLPFTTNMPSNIKIRWATTEDVSAMTAVYFNSFYTSHLFWHAFLPDRPSSRKWWDDAWTVGIKNDPSARTLVAVDLDPDATNKVRYGPNGEKIEGSTFTGKHGETVVAFCRWIIPQDDGNLQRVWPDITDDFDMSIAGPFFEGMDANRLELMGAKPHWMLEMLGTAVPYQGCGIGIAFLKWGCHLADTEDMEVYLDASQKGAPLYQKAMGFQLKLEISLPERHGEGEYGTYKCISHVRPRLSARS